MKIEMRGGIPQVITTIKPFDAHDHPRDGETLEETMGHHDSVFCGGIEMGNLPGADAITDPRKMLLFQQRIRRVASPGYEPYMSLLIGDQTSPFTIEQASHNGALVAKVYPKGVTNADFAVEDFLSFQMRRLYGAAIGCDLTVSGHFELPAVEDAVEMSMFDREYACLGVFEQIHREYPNMRLVFEHGTRAETFQLFRGHLRPHPKVAVTITPHQLSWTSERFWDGSRVYDPTYYCRPVLQSEKDRIAGVELAVEHPQAFLGTDRAAHDWETSKVVTNPKPGIWMPGVGHISLVFEQFEAVGELDRAEDFCSIRGPEFYGLKPSDEMITFVREPWRMPGRYPVGGGYIRPGGADEVRQWQLAT